MIVPRVLGRFFTQRSAKALRDRLNEAARQGKNAHRRYYTVERRLLRWHVVKHYEKETNT